MEIFHRIHEFYIERKFTDVRIVAGDDVEDQQVHCHSLVLASAVPALKSLLQDHSRQDEDQVTLVFPDIPFQNILSAVDDIYACLILDDVIDEKRKKSWSELLGIFFRPVVSIRITKKPEPEVRTSSGRARKKRKRFSLIDDDYEEELVDNDEAPDSPPSPLAAPLQPPTLSRRKAALTSPPSSKKKASSSIPAATLVLGRGRNMVRMDRPKVKNEPETEDAVSHLVNIKSEVDFTSEHNYTMDDLGMDYDFESRYEVAGLEENFMNEVAGDEAEEEELLQILENVERRIRAPPTERFVNSNSEVTQTATFAKLNTSQTNANTATFPNLTRFTESILNGNKDSLTKYFTATSAGLYLKDGSATHFPPNPESALPVEETADSIPLIPKGVFTGIFAIGINNDENLAKPVAVYSQSQSADSVCANFLPLIKKIAQVSSRTILESARHDSFSCIDKDQRSRKSQLRARVLESDERELVLEKNRKYNDDQDRKSIPILSNAPLPDQPIPLTFRLTNELHEDQIFDFVIVYGDRINALTVQSYARTAKTRADQLTLMVTLIDAMAAFCRLEYATDLHKVTYFRGLLDTHYDRIFEKAALEVVTPKAKQVAEKRATKTNDPMEADDEDMFNVTSSVPTTGRVKPSSGFRARRRTLMCMECRELFDVGTLAEKQAFEAHKLSHVGCDCDIIFTSDAHYRVHMKSVHIQKKKFKCEFGNCNQHYSSQAALEKHFQLIHEKLLEDGVGVICAVCGQTFVNQHYLKAHHLCYHKETPCPVCGEVFAGKLAQDKHHRNIHATLDDHLCQHCGRGFKLKKYLQIHIINSHTAKQDKPFPCHLCEKGFNNHMKLTQHLDGVHYKRKPYKCRAGGDVCTMAFSAQSTRKRHEKVAHKLDIRLPKGRKSTSKVATGAGDDDQML